MVSPPVVDAAGQIWVAGRDAGGRAMLAVLSADGGVLDKQPLDPAHHPSGDNDSIDSGPPASLALTNGGVWLLGTQTIELRGAGGDVRMRVPIARKSVLASSLTPDGDLVLLHREHFASFRLDRLGRDGSMRWSISAPYRGYIYRAAIACDDRGAIYVVGEGRIGDGVSGDDRPTGGLMIVSASGVINHTDAESDARRRGSTMAAGEASVVLGERRQIEIDDRGVTLREIEVSGDDPDAVRLDAMDMRLAPRSRLLNPAVLLGFHGSVTHVYRPAVDASGKRYVVLSRLMTKTKPCLVALDTENRILFRLEEQKTGALSSALAMGPDRTLLAVSGRELLAID